MTHDLKVKYESNYPANYNFRIYHNKQYSHRELRQWKSTKIFTVCREELKFEPLVSLLFIQGN